MRQLLAQLEKDQALAEGYWGLVWIVSIGLLGIAVLLFAILSRRWVRRQVAEIEKDKAERRQAQSAGRVDAWRAGADRYVDRDKLPDDADTSYPDDEIEEDEPVDEADDLDEKTDLEDDGDPPPGWDDDEPPPQDPYGLFEDKPYRDPDDDEDEYDDEDEEPDDGDWDPDEDEENRRR